MFIPLNASLVFNNVFGPMKKFVDPPLPKECEMCGSPELIEHPQLCAECRAKVEMHREANQ